MIISSNRAVTPVIATVLMVVIVLVLAAVVTLSVGPLGDSIVENPRVAISDQQVESVGDCNTEIRLTHIGGDPVKSENLLLVTTQKVDIGSESGTAPNCPEYSTTRERIGESDSNGIQAGIGETWTAGESFRFGSDNLEGTSVKLVWNPERVADAGTGGNSDFGEINADTGYIIYEKIF